MNTEVQHEMKIYEHWQDPIERARINKLKSVKCVVAQICKASQLTFYNKKRSRRLGADPEFRIHHCLHLL